MKVALFLMLFGSVQAMATERGLYVSDTGRVTAPCVLFIHGGPGYNSWTFEASMTDSLIGAGYRVITFDQRGCGRSDKAPLTAYTFDNALLDIDSILDERKINKVILIGHSFGGTLALKWARSRPHRVSALLLIGSPLSYPNTFATIALMMNKADTTAFPGLAYSRSRLPTLDTTGVEYVGSCFTWAMRLGAYACKEPLEIGTSTKALIGQMPDKKWASSMTQPPFMGFLKNEQYATLSLVDDVSACVIKGLVPLVLIGADDGLFGIEHRNAWVSVLGRDQVHIVEHASHTVFIDRPDVVMREIQKLRLH